MLDLYGTVMLGIRKHHVEPERLAKSAQWAEEAGLSGTLIFTDNSSLDVWQAAQFIIERTERLVPLVAVQPVYMSPYTAARMVATTAALYERRIDLNFVAGGHGPSLRVLNGFLEHDDRYERLVEYGRLMMDLLEPGNEVHREGAYYSLGPVTLWPELISGLTPRTFLAGTSPACREAARRLGCVRLDYPREVSEYDDAAESLSGSGIRIGVIARKTAGEAWEEAQRRFPGDPRLEFALAAGMRDVDAHWYQTIWSDSKSRRGLRNTYWMHPLRASREYCPFLVGDYDEVAGRLTDYLRAGVSTLILSSPWYEDDYFHAMKSVRLAERIFAGGQGGASAEVGASP